MAKTISQDVYLGLLSLFFMSYGIWAGKNSITKKNKTTFEIKTSDDIRNHLGLSEREMDVLHGIAQGISYQQIADKLFLSQNTIKTPTSNLFSKLQVKRRIQAILEARKIGLIT